MLTALSPINFIEIGTPVAGPFFSDTVAVPLYAVVLPLVLGLPVILKSVIVCLCAALPFNINILNVALNIGELEVNPLKSHIPEVTHSGFPSFPFCILAIVPSTLSGFCALAIGNRALLLLAYRLKDTIVIIIITIATSIGIALVDLLFATILVPQNLCIISFYTISS